MPFAGISKRNMEDLSMEEARAEFDALSDTIP
jgi:hypothetical protein